MNINELLTEHFKFLEHARKKATATKQSFKMPSVRQLILGTLFDDSDSSDHCLFQIEFCSEDERIARAKAEEDRVQAETALNLLQIE
jgi:hypothetical protein